MEVPLYKGDYIELLIEKISRSTRRAKYIKFFWSPWVQENNNKFCSLALDSAHMNLDFLTGSYFTGRGQNQE